MKHKFPLLCLLSFVLYRSTDGACSSTTKYATTSLQTISNIYYSNNEYCTISIRPNGYYSSSNYYLEIKWMSFNVEGDLPNCKDYVEVFLTSSYESIGKYCSDNMVDSKPFSMYAHDGYAKITFKSDSSITRSGFSLTYRLKSKSIYPMGGAATRTCPYSDLSDAATFYSSGWPNSYYTTSSPCWKSYYSGSKVVRVAVMDVSLYRISSYYCYSTDSFFEVKESSSFYSLSSYISVYATSVSGKLCGTRSPKVYTSRKNYLYLYMNRPRFSSGKRGVMVGYMAYREATKPSSSSASGVVIGAVIGSIVAVAAIAGAVYVCYRLSHSKRPGTVAVQSNGHQGNTVVTSNIMVSETKPVVSHHGDQSSYPAASMAPNAYPMAPPQYAPGMVPNNNIPPPGPHPGYPPQY